MVTDCQGHLLCFTVEDVCVRMAWNSECDLFDSSNFHSTSTPNVPYSSANIDEKCGSRCVNDSGYFTQLKPFLTRPSLAEQSVEFFPLNLEISEEDTGHINTNLSSGALVSDSDTDYESIENTEQECRIRSEDVTSIYSPPDTVDCLATTASYVSEDSSFTHYSSHGSVLEKYPAMVEQPCRMSHVDFIRHLSHIPHVLAVILHHVSDADLCRLQRF